jgi:hypothetical protein
MQINRKRSVIKCTSLTLRVFSLGMVHLKEQDGSIAEFFSLFFSSSKNCRLNCLQAKQSSRDVRLEIASHFKCMVWSVFF